MPRLDAFDITIRTGARGRSRPPHFVINGYPLEFDTHTGSTEPGDVFEAHGDPGSFPHSLMLAGPEEGSWDIEAVTITYYPDGEEPYSVELGACTLDDDADLNINHPRPAPVFDV